MLLLIDLTSYTTNMKNKILKKRLYIIVDIKCKDSVIRKKVAKPVIYIKTDYLYRLTLHRGNKDNKNIRIRFYFNNILDYGKSKIEQWH